MKPSRSFEAGLLAAITMPGKRASPAPAMAVFLIRDLRLMVMDGSFLLH
jgi:hypothetical protein